MVVENVVVKYYGKEHALHIKAALEGKYKVTTYWDGEIYVGISLTWDYDKCTVQLAMPGYVRAELHSFQHEKTKI